MRRVAAHRYIETILLSAITVASCLYINPQDPLFIHQSFPWIWFLPILIALRHGRACAAISVAFIIVTMLYTMHTLLFSWDSYQVWLLGGITMVLIYTEHQQLWLKRQYGLQEREFYLDSRLESLSRAYGVLRLSHDRLEESLINKPATLRQAFASLRKLLSNSGGELNPLVATQYMELLTYQAGLNSAALYLYVGKQLNKNAIAFIGANKSLNADDVLIKRCLKKHKTAYVALNLLEDNQTSDYLAVIPMETADGRMLGLLTITDIPFLLLNEDTLQKLSLLLAYIADETWAAAHAIKLQSLYPSCPSMFASELFKLMHLWKISRVDSAIVTYHLKASDAREDILFFLIKERRDLDIFWESEINDTIILILLMPLTERSMLTGYVERIQNLLWQHKQIKLGESPVLFDQKQLSDYSDPYVLLKGIFSNDSI